MSIKDDRLETFEKATADAIRRHVSLSPTKVHTIGSISHAFALSVEDVASILERVACVVSGPRVPLGARTVELT